MANEPKMHLRAVAPGFHCIARRAAMTSGSAFRTHARLPASSHSFDRAAAARFH
jgi:hypothetical protein